jgi:hypothetical protein
MTAEALDSIPDVQSYAEGGDGAGCSGCSRIPGQRSIGLCERSALKAQWRRARLGK